MRPLVTLNGAYVDGASFADGGREVLTAGGDDVVGVWSTELARPLPAITALAHRRERPGGG